MMKIDKTANSKMPFIQVPKVLVENERYRHVSVAAILLYALLLDRYKIAIRNSNAWRNNQGQVYICYTIADTQRHIRCGHDKACGLFRELQNAGLINRKRKGLGLESQIIVYLPEECEAKTEIMNTKLQDSEKTDYWNSGIEKTETNKTITKKENRYTNNTQLTMESLAKEKMGAVALCESNNENNFEKIFSELYKLYPDNRKGIRLEAYETFKKTIVTYEDAQMALENCKKWCSSVDWKNEGGKYIPLLKNYLLRSYWRRKPLVCHNTIWGSGELGEEELEAICKMMRD